MDLHLDLDLEGLQGGSLKARLERALREAARDGRLPPGTRLPSTRALCAQLGVSRGVVVDAYAQLAAEGYLRTRRGAGTTIAPAISTKRPSRTADGRTTPAKYDMNPFRPALGGFPRATWSAALSRALRGAPDERLGYPDPAGTSELRATLAAYLGRIRGVRADPDQVVVTCGMRHGLDLLFTALAGDGASTVAVEQPGWRGIVETAVSAGLRTVPIEVDREGILVERLHEHDVDAVALAPAHQFPTGAVLSAGRRAELLAWAQARGRLLVEDDYDAEYRYDRQPIGSLQGLAPEHVAYGGSTSKTLAPALRLGWMVLPRPLVDPLLDVGGLRGATPSPLIQLAFADLIERGELDRHLRRQRRLYKRQRERLLAALAEELPGLAVQGAAAGLYVVLHLPEDVEEAAALAAARSRGLALEGGGGSDPTLVLGYANLPQAAVGAAVKELATGLREAQRRVPPGGRRASF